MAGLEEGKAIDRNTPIESDSDEYSSSPEPCEEEQVFSMLFSQCDTQNTGLVKVDTLVDYIRSVQLGPSNSEVLYDSQIDVTKLQYNLHLLKAMLECNSTKEEEVDQATYSHIIKMWVKDIRGRTQSTGSHDDSELQVSALSDSGEAQPDWLGDSGSHDPNSFETSGGDSSQQSIDKLELMSSVANLKNENRQLHERNTTLQLQMENSEENFKDIQRQNIQLTQNIKEAQTNLARLDTLQGDNDKMAQLLDSVRSQCLDLENHVTALEKQLKEAQEDLSMTQTQLSNADVDKAQMQETNRALELLLTQKEQLLSANIQKQMAAESQLRELQHHQTELSQTIADLNEANENLRTENADLQSTGPLSSTPYRPTGQSWAQELDSLANRGSPIKSGGSPSTTDPRMDSLHFSQMLQETNTKLNETHNLIVREITDIINIPSPSLSSRTGESSHTLLTERISEKGFQAFEAKLSEILRQKKQLQNENIDLAAQVADLTRRLQQLEEQEPSPVFDHSHGLSNEAPLPPSRKPALSRSQVASYSFEDPQPLQHARPALTRSEMMLHSIDESPVGERADLVTREPENMFQDVDLIVEEPIHMTPLEELVENIPLPVVEEPAHMTDHPGPLEDFAGIRRRHSELMENCAQLESRAEQLEGRTDWWGLLGGVCALLLLLLLLMIALVVVHDSFDSCGPFCPHSPVSLLYSMIDPLARLNTNPPL